jgi:hypothetical protein
MKSLKKRRITDWESEDLGFSELRGVVRYVRNGSSQLWTTTDSRMSMYYYKNKHPVRRLILLSSRLNCKLNSKQLSNKLNNKQLNNKQLNNNLNCKLNCKLLKSRLRTKLFIFEQDGICVCVRTAVCVELFEGPVGRFLSKYEPVFFAPSHADVSQQEFRNALGTSCDSRGSPWIDFYSSAVRLGLSDFLSEALLLCCSNEHCTTREQEVVLDGAHLYIKGASEKTLEHFIAPLCRSCNLTKGIVIKLLKHVPLIGIRAFQGMIELNWWSSKNLRQSKKLRQRMSPRERKL